MTALNATLIALALLPTGYLVLIAYHWIRFGRSRSLRRNEDSDELLDRFLPHCQAMESHRIAVRAPAADTFAAACEFDLLDWPLVRPIFRVREWLLGGHPDHTARPRGMVAQMKSIGWGVLAEVPGREIVMGAVTRPWEAHPVFRALPPAQFAGFAEPGFVKIAWTLRADPQGEDGSIFRTQTRAQATDAAASRRFRWYWAKAAPGIWLIRRLTLRPVRQAAKLRARSRTQS